MNTTPPPTIVTFVSPKGGVGKSTCCLALASSLAAKGNKVDIIDFDQTETLWRWYSRNQTARAIHNLTVERGPDTDDLAGFFEKVWTTRSGYVFIDLAGSLTHHTLLLATFAHITITPSKLNEPDMVEAAKLSAQLDALANKVGKPINHRILLNEVPTFLPTHQAHTLDELDRSNLVRFKTLIHSRAAFPETWLTGQPPHFADQSRDTIHKAVKEIDLLTAEFLEAVALQEERIAA